MSIEAIVAHPNPEPRQVSTKEIPAQALGSQKPSFVAAPTPEPAVINIDREPLISATELAAKIGELNAKLMERNQAVAFSTDASTGHDVVKVTNVNTGELIRQMPSLEALKAMQNMDQMMGLIFKGMS